MQFRKATKKDKEQAMNIAKDLKEWFTERGIKDMKTDFKLNNVVVAFDKKEIYGFICYTSYSGKMQLIWMGVKRDVHRKGVGQKLLKWLEKEAKKYDLYSIEVETLPDEYNYEPYKKTLAFYYKMGFKRIAYKKARIKGWDDQILLEKKIN
jgi:N-acetylglutamate synthase-like GNAT family acetyltransferase